MRIVPPDEFREMLISAMRRLPKSMQPKHIEAAALMMVEQPPLDRLEIRVGEGMDFRDLSPR